MRTIKFRAWDETNGVMIDKYVNGVDSYGELRVAQFAISGQTEFPQLTLMQFTGLHDKHDTEIYEGDVIRINEGDNALVFWSDEFLAYYVEWVNVRGCVALSVWRPQDVEVIGNIYESPAK